MERLVLHESIFSCLWYPGSLAVKKSGYGLSNVHAATVRDFIHYKIPTRYKTDKDEKHPRLHLKLQLNMPPGSYRGHNPLAYTKILQDAFQKIYYNNDRYLSGLTAVINDTEPENKYSLDFEVTPYINEDNDLVNECAFEYPDIYTVNQLYKLSKKGTKSNPLALPHIYRDKKITYSGYPSPDIKTRALLIYLSNKSRQDIDAAAYVYCDSLMNDKLREVNVRKTNFVKESKFLASFL
jgi:hypothetical protein